jgi:hypothetical protein
MEKYNLPRQSKKKGSVKKMESKHTAHFARFMTGSNKVEAK